MIDAKLYPYDPKLPLSKMAQAVGLERLRWIPDRGFAQVLADLYERTKDPRMVRACEQFELRAAAEQRAKLILIAEASLRGDHGDEARDTACHFFQSSPQRADLPRLQAFLTELQRLNIDVHQMPSRRGGGGRRFRESE